MQGVAHVIGRLGRIYQPVPANAPSLRKHAIANRTAPAKLDRSGVDYRPQMLGNDTLANCTCALVGNAVLGQAALSGYQANVTENDAIGLYMEAAGYIPGQPATDEGAVEVAVLSYQAMRGLVTSEPSPLVGLWANIETGDLNLLRCATAALGVGYLGVALAAADGIEGVVWDTDTPASYGDPTPGSLGGHALGLWSWAGLGDTDLVHLVTWGRLQVCTWRWLRSRMDECHMIVHPQIIGTDGLRIAGVDAGDLVGDIEAFAA